MGAERRCQPRPAVAEAAPEPRRSGNAEVTRTAPAGRGRGPVPIAGPVERTGSVRELQHGVARNGVPRQGAAQDVAQDGGRAPIRVLVADDDETVRSGFRLMLGIEHDIEVVGDAATGVHAVEMARRLCPDVVLVDIRMPRAGRAGRHPRDRRATRSARGGRGHHLRPRRVRLRRAARRCVRLPAQGRGPDAARRGRPGGRERRRAGLAVGHRPPAAAPARRPR